MEHSPLAERTLAPGLAESGGSEDRIERIVEDNRLETLGTLASGIAHEINNPAQYVGDNLVFIRGAIARLLDFATEVQRTAQDGRDWAWVPARLGEIKLDFLRQELPAAASQAIDGIERIGTIAQAVRDFCYPARPLPSPFDLNHLIETTAAITRTQWKPVAALDLDLDPDLPAITGVEGEIAQVLANLIINAAHAIAELRQTAAGRVTLASRRQGDRVEIVVADTGRGIDPVDIPRIFELFYTTKPPGLGTGQGLAISHAIVTRHGGSIGVDSSPGAGARFRISLPIAGPTAPP